MVAGVPGFAEVYAGACTTPAGVIFSACVPIV